MKQVRIKDNSSNGKEIFSAIPSLTGKVANKTLEQLEKEGVFVFPDLSKGADGLTQDQMVLQDYNDTYRSSNVMGFLGYGDERLTIASRFGGDDNDLFLQYLLEKVLDFPNAVCFEASATSDSQLLNLLVYLFPRYLKDAMRKGLFKTYIRTSYNDANPKGTVNIARHIKENTPFIGKIAYSQREFSYDNYLIELIRHTVELIKQKRTGHYILSAAKDEVKLIIEATPKYRLQDRQKVLAANKKKVVRHAYFREYRALQYLCTLILQNQKQEIGSGVNRVYGILFDGAWLWEEYVNLLIKDTFYHPMNKAGKGAQRLFSSSSEKIGLIYPDFISKNANKRIIADAKYKPISNIGNHDYFQVLAYMMRFEAKTGFYLYPESGEEKDLQLWVNSGSTYENNVKPQEDLCVVKHGLRIPNNADNYSDFSEKMRKSEADFRKILINP